MEIDLHCAKCGDKIECTITEGVLKGHYRINKYNHIFHYDCFKTLGVRGSEEFSRMIIERINNAK